MQMSLARSSLASYVAAQAGNLFPDQSLEAVQLQDAVDQALERLEHCFRHIHIKYYFDGTQTVFNHLHTDQYAMFLYFLSNTLFRRGDNPALAAKVYALNKALHAVDVFYEVQLPDIFLFQHPVGTVLGRAQYSDYLLVYQRCSVGANLNHVYPRLGRGVVMYGGSAVIGQGTVGDNCWLSVNATLLDTSVGPNNVVFGRSPQHVEKPAKRDVVRDLFHAA